jgi:hypothetical protein
MLVAVTSAVEERITHGLVLEGPPLMKLSAFAMLGGQFVVHSERTWLGTQILAMVMQMR